jgi:hypothetical protein
MLSGQKEEVTRMSGKYWAPIMLMCGLLLAAVPAVAHHSVAAEYELANGSTTYTGTLVQMEWINPHAMLHLEVTGQDGTKTIWIFQTTSAGALREKGLARGSAGGLKVGDTYTIVGFPAKSGKPQGLIKSLTMPDKRVVTVWFGDPNGN